MTRFWSILLIAALAWGEDDGKKKTEDKPKPKSAGEIEIADPGVQIQDSSSARREVARFVKAFKANKKDELKCAELIKEMLGKWDHPLVLKEAKKLVKNKSHFVAIQAVIVFS